MPKTGLGPKMYESLTNQQFIEVYQTVAGLEKRLGHPEFQFVRYLLKMVLQELDDRDRSGDVATGPAADDEGQH